MLYAILLIHQSKIIIKERKRTEKIACHASISECNWMENESPVFNLEINQQLCIVVLLYANMGASELCF